MGLGNLVFHTGMAAKLIYDRVTLPSDPEANVFATFGGVHLFLAYQFLSYVRDNKP